MSAPIATGRSASDAERGWRRWWPYALIALVTFYCHWFILTNDGPIWDGWYWVEWLKTRNWAPMKEYTSAQALPYTLWAFAPFAYVSAIVPTAMWASFLCLVADGVLIYLLGRRLALLGRTEALAIALLAQALPLFSAGQDMPVFGLIVFRTLFYAGALLATLSLDRTGWQHWLLRLGALVAFYFACITNGALLVYYGGVWLLLWIRYRRQHGLTLAVATQRFVLRYPDYFVLPPAVFAARMIFLPQFGWYEHYNTPGDNFGQLGKGIWSFVANVLPYHAKTTALWPVEHPILAVLLAAGVAVWLWKAPPHWRVARGETRDLHLYWFGAVLLFFAVFPLAAAGKIFDPLPVGEPSRHCMLVGLPLAILLFAALRGAFFRKGASSRGFAVALAASVVIFGSQYLPSYLKERAEWVASRSILHNVVRHPAVRDASVILGSDCSVFHQGIYGIYGLQAAFGERTRFAGPFRPGNNEYLQPSEIEWYSYSTTVIAGQFSRINPGGRQVVTQSDRNRGDMTDWDIAMRYLGLRWFGSTSEMDAFLTSFTKLKWGLLRDVTPMDTSGPPPTPVAPVPPRGTAPTGPFTNGIGIELAHMTWGMWVARHETTQAQFKSVMGRNPSLFVDPYRPVECVTWLEAVEFCEKLTALESAEGRLPAGFLYRLPSVAERDRFAAFGSVREAVLNEGLIKWSTARVGSRKADELGLHDVIGNVWEWCLDVSELNARLRVSEGGGFSSRLEDLVPFTKEKNPALWLDEASKYRLLGPTRRDYPDQGYWNRGFRVILAPPAPAASASPSR